MRTLLSKAGACGRAAIVRFGAVLCVVGVSCTQQGPPTVDDEGVDQPNVVNEGSTQATSGGTPPQPTGTATSSARRSLTAAFENVPAGHDGESAFRFRVAFSEDIATSYKTLRDESFTVTEGEVTAARRIDGRDDLWEITVEPDSREAVTVTLPGGRACRTSGAVCTGGNDPAPLSNNQSATVQYMDSRALTLSSHFYVLGVETVEFERFAALNTGGAIESLGDDLLLATPSGRLALITSNGAVEYLDGQVPMNHSALDAIDLDPVVKGRFRVADILLKENSAGVVELFVTHHYFGGGGGVTVTIGSGCHPRHLYWKERTSRYCRPGKRSSTRSHA